MPKIRIGIVGCGYWGQNLLRNFWEVEEAQVAIACDLDSGLLGRARRRYPALELTRSYAEVLANPTVDAVVFATPVGTHYNLARQALEADKHVLVEKPLSTNSEQALELIDLAHRRRKVLMVDHTFLYTGAVRRIKELIDNGEIGELLYYDSVRINLGLIQSDTNVLWDLGPHDFSIMDYLCGCDPISVTAVGVGHLDHCFENIAYVTLRFESKLIAHVHLNWLAPVKVRTTLVGGSRKMIVYDDIEASEKVKVYDRGVSLSHNPERRVRMLADYRDGDIVAPHLDTTEALRLVAREFLRSILDDRPPLTDGLAGYRVVRILEAAQQSMEQNGRPIELPDFAFSRLVDCTTQPVEAQTES